MVRCLLKSKCVNTHMKRAWVGGVLITPDPTWFNLTETQFSEVKNGAGFYWVDVLEVKQEEEPESLRQNDFTEEILVSEISETKRRVRRLKKYAT